MATKWLRVKRGFAFRSTQDQPAGPVEDGPTLVSLLREDFQPLWAILDAARDEAILPMLRESKAEFQSLYEGARGEQLSRGGALFGQVANGVEVD